MQKAAIIGSGPAGLACAQTLVEKNFKVIVFEELDVFGGMPAYGLPEFRMPAKLSEKKINSLKERGIVFEKKKINSVKKLLLEGFDYVIIAIGAGEGKKLGLEGESSPKVIDSLKLLQNSKVIGKKMLAGGEKVCVIGGGNSAIDAAREVLRQTGECELIYRRTEKEMPAFAGELDEAKKEGVKFTFLLAPKEFVEKNNKLEITFSEMVLGKEDENGRKQVHETGKTIARAYDKAVLAVGQKNETKWIEKDEITCENGKIIANENGKTSVKKIYACGDCVTGAKNIAFATIAGIKTAKQIISDSENIS